MSQAAQELRGHSSETVLFLRKITPAVEKYCYWALSPANKKAHIKKDVALALLYKILPSKVEGDAPQTHIILIRPENQQVKSGDLPSGDFSIERPAVQLDPVPG